MDYHANRVFRWISEKLAIGHTQPTKNLALPAFKRDYTLLDVFPAFKKK